MQDSVNMVMTLEGHGLTPEAGGTARDMFRGLNLS
jgi:hypothetical protein